MKISPFKPTLLSLFFLVLLAFPLSLTSSQDNLNSLKNIYKTGKIEFKPELKLTADSFPEDVPTKSILGFACRKGKIYLSDPYFSDIKILTYEGKYLKSFGRKGRGPSDLFYPYLLAFSLDNLVVWEAGNRRLSVFTPEGKFIKHAAPSNKARIRDMKTLANGNILVEREISKVISGEFSQFFVLELYSPDLEFIKVLYKKKIFRNLFVTKPRRTNIVQPFPADVSWDTLPGNKVVVGYSGNYEIKIINPSTDAERSFKREYVPVKITEKDRAVFFGSIITSGRDGKRRKGAAHSTRKKTVFPANKPAFKRLMSDCEGNILVFVYTDSDNGKDAYNATCFDAFDSNGGFINRVEIIPSDGINSGKLHSEKNNLFWGYEIIESLDTALVKYRVK